MMMSHVFFRLQKVKEDESQRSDDLEEDVEEGDVILEPDSTGVCAH